MGSAALRRRSGMTGQPAKPGLKITAAERPNTLGINQRDLVTLLQKIEAGEKGKAPIRRDFTRWPFRHATVKVTLVQPSGGEVHLRLACRNLSRGGISLLHNAFIHPGSAVSVSLPRLAGEAKEIPGVVKRCLHRRGVLHEIGVQFETPIDLREFLGASQGQEFFSIEKIEPEKLTGNVLYIEDCDVDYRILQHFLRETNLNVERVATGEDAMDKLSNQDLIICDWRLPDIDGITFVRQIRDMELPTPVLLVTADPVGLMRSGIWDIANTGLLTKPLSQQQLMRAIAERLLVSTRDPNAELAAKGSNIASIQVNEMFVAQFQQFAEKLQAAASENDIATIVSLAMQIKGSAPSCGANKLALLATQAHSAFSGGADQAKRNRILADLLAACRHLDTAA